MGNANGNHGNAYGKWSLHRFWTNFPVGKNFCLLRLKNRIAAQLTSGLCSHQTPEKFNLNFYLYFRIRFSHAAATWTILPNPYESCCYGVPAKTLCGAKPFSNFGVFVSDFLRTTNSNLRNSSWLIGKKSSKVRSVHNYSEVKTNISSEMFLENEPFRQFGHVLTTKIVKASKESDCLQSTPSPLLPHTPWTQLQCQWKLIFDFQSQINL